MPARFGVRASPRIAAACHAVMFALLVGLYFASPHLGAVYLGGNSFSSLARAGRVVEARPGALRRADAMFAWDPAPWCPAIF